MEIIIEAIIVAQERKQTIVNNVFYTIIIRDKKNGEVLV